MPRWRRRAATGPNPNPNPHPHPNPISNPEPGPHPKQERGHFRRCQHILTAGLQHCPLHEALLLKAIKHLERIGELEAARALLGQLRGVPVDKSWRTLLEGALPERAPNPHPYP